jgi:hypothetical protein
LTGLGVDVADPGGDKTVFAPRFGLYVGDLEVFDSIDTMQATGKIFGRVNGTHVKPTVDAIGLGAPIVGRLRELGVKVRPFVASRSSEKKDENGEMGFADIRAEAWWSIRESLNPQGANFIPYGIPPNDDLIGELTAPTWRVMSNGKIRVESKEDIRKRIHRSTDHADAVIQVLWAGDTTSRIEEEIVTGGSRRYGERGSIFR